MAANVDRITHQGRILAIIIPAGFEREGIEFFTPDSFSQQLAYMKRPAGHEIDPHVHNEVHREVLNTLEVLYVKSGRLRVDLYDDDRNFVAQRELSGGDVIMLSAGGHGFTMLEETELIEIKQGPFSGDQDKTRFEPESRGPGAAQ